MKLKINKERNHSFLCNTAQIAAFYHPKRSQRLQIARQKAARSRIADLRLRERKKGAPSSQDPVGSTSGERKRAPGHEIGSAQRPRRKKAQCEAGLGERTARAAWPLLFREIETGGEMVTGVWRRRRKQRSSSCERGGGGEARRAVGLCVGGEEEEEEGVGVCIAAATVWGSRSQSQWRPAGGRPHSSPRPRLARGPTTRCASHARARARACGRLVLSARAVKKKKEAARLPTLTQVPTLSTLTTHVAVLPFPKPLPQRRPPLTLSPLLPPPTPPATNHGGVRHPPPLALSLSPFASKRRRGPQGTRWGSTFKMLVCFSLQSCH